MDSKPIKDLNTKKIKGIFFDIDDTFSSEGKITAKAYNALWSLRNAGLIVVPITGRPAGWCDHIARMWPVTAVIGENGAFYMMLKNGKLERTYIGDPKSMQEHKTKLEIIKNEVFEIIPNAGIASDQNYREFDLAIDFCEDVKPLLQNEISQIVDIFKKHGANVKISSIHVNGWFGDYDKLTAAKIFAKNELGLDLNDAQKSFVFCGDSPNDEPMFEFFDNSVGVANVMDFEGRIQHWAKYITKGRSGEGFAELADSLIK